jgi:hypothetical protein
MKKPKVITFGKVFPDPDMVGESNYRAIYDVIVDGVFDGNVPDDDYILTPDEIGGAREALDGFKDWVSSLRKQLPK